MKKEKKPWTSEEFKAYLLLSASQSNFNEAYEEQEIILKYVSKETCERLHREIANDNDYQVTQKILDYLIAHNYTKDDIDQLLREVEELFEADGEVDSVEHNYMLGLHRVLETVYKKDDDDEEDETDED